jgi:hypothetical protein
MRTWTIRILIAITLAVAASGVAWTQDGEDGKQCQLATLKGSYVFTANGFNIVNGVPVPKAIVELIDFNGDGTLTVPGATVSINGVITQTPPGGVGDYTLEPNCTGTIAFATAPPRFTIYVEPTGKNGWMIQTNPNTVFQGTVMLLHR